MLYKCKNIPMQPHVKWLGGKIETKDNIQWQINTLGNNLNKMNTSKKYKESPIVENVEQLQLHSISWHRRKSYEKDKKSISPL